MEVILVAAAAVLLTLPVLLNRYWQHLPEAPWCPHCRAVTHRLHDDQSVHRLVDALPMPITAVRTCSGCGWQGRMRWRWAPRRARREGE